MQIIGMLGRESKPHPLPLRLLTPLQADSVADDDVQPRFAVTRLQPQPRHRRAIRAYAFASDVVRYEDDGVDAAAARVDDNASLSFKVYQ